MYWIFLLVFLVACQSVEIIEVIPDPPKPPVVFFPEQPQQQPIRSQEFSLVEGRKEFAIIDGAQVSLQLMEVANNESRILINGTSIEFGNESITFLGLEWEVIEALENNVTVPRRSYTDGFFNGVRRNLDVGENISFGNSSLKVDFIGLQDGIPSVRFVVDDESEILAEDGEHTFTQGRVYVQRIYFFDERSSLKADVVTMRVRESS